ncbi:MAG: metallophosphoesterase family protein [Betaproteobacteria bacterium]
MRIGVISDTHGLLRPAALEAVRGCDALIHAGDIGSQAVLDALAEIAPLTAVRGNNDAESWAHTLPEEVWIAFERVGVYVLHDVNTLRPQALTSAVQVVVSGHSHKPAMQMRNGVLYFNPGSAGPRRFSLPISVGLLEIDGTRLSPRLQELSV